MTQEVQPLTWSKRTNIEEHQQFFSKINEIIGNLAPTVDKAEQAIAQATAAIDSANDAVTTANAASAAASAAASQAQTAATTVAGYDGRLTAAEGDIAAIEGREPDYLKKTGAPQTVTSQIMVPTTAAGARDTQIANGTRIQNDLAAYEPMVRTTGNQVIGGEKKFINTPVIAWNVNTEGQYYHEYVRLSADDASIPVVTVIGAQDPIDGDYSTVAQLNVYNKGRSTDSSRLFLTHTPTATLLQLRRYKNGAIVNTVTIGQIQDP